MKDSGVEWVGEIPDEWSIRRIKNLFFVISGATPSSNADNWDGEIIWITPADYKTNDKYIAQGKRNLSVVGYNNCSTSLVPVGSLIFSKRAPIGTVAMNAVPLCTNQGCLSCVKKNEEIDTTYYYYVLSVGTEHFELMGSGTTFKEISASTFSNCSLPFPEVADQRRIADYLDAKCAEIDKVVEKTRETIEEYKKLKQSIITETVTKGLNPDAEMKDSGIPWIGKIPDSWRNNSIRHLLVARDGGAWGEEVKDEDEGIVCLRVADFDYSKGRFVDLDERELTHRKYTNTQVKRLMLYPGDICVEKSGGGEKTPVGRAVLFDKNYTALFANFMERLRFNIALVLSEFAEYWFRMWYSCRCSPYYINQTTGIQNIDLTLMLAKEKMFFPNIDEQRRIADYLDAKCAELDNIIEKKEQLIEELGSYKKSLIYEYVTGKKEVQA